MHITNYLRPSAAAVWSRCAGYASLSAAIGAEFQEETDNEVREDGTACHWLAEQVWNGAQPEVGKLSPNGREITDEMYAAVAEYHELLKGWGRDPVLEQSIAVSRFFPGVADGTPDAWNFDGDTLHVADLKFGFRPVDVWRNPQLTIYAWTLVCLLTELGNAPQTVMLHIVQPRCAHRDGTTRSWTVSVSELAELAAALAEAARACYAPAPLCTPGPQCGNCPAAYGCRSLQAAAGAAMEISYDATPFVLNEQQLGYELSRLMTAAKRMEDRINGLSVQAESLLRKGVRVPAFELRPKATRWRWRAGTEPVIRRLGEMFGVPVMQEPKVRSVAQLRDAFPIDVQAMYAEKPSGETVLRLTDPNEAVRRFEK